MELPTPPVTRTKRLIAVACFLVVLLFVVVENSCVFGGLSRRIVFRRIKISSGPVTSSEDRNYGEGEVKEIPLDDVAGLERRMTKVQLVPLWPNNDTLKVC